MWQSRIDYSIAYIERITEFNALLRSASAKGGTHTRFIDASNIRVLQVDNTA